MQKKVLNILVKLEKPTIYFTATCILLAGFLRLINYKYSNYILNYCLLPYIVVRALYYILIVFDKDKKLTGNQLNRLYVFIVICITVMLSIFNFFSADFFVMFLIMIDYLMLDKEEKSDT